MKTYPLAVAGVAGAVVLVAALAVVAQQTDDLDPGTQTGQDTQATQAGQANQAGQADENRGAGRSRTGGAGPDVGKLDEGTTGATVRASQLMGANIVNPRGEEVGEVEDLVIDRSGRVRYAAVTYGGFLGFGGKLFAVPFEAFQVQVDPEEADDDERAEADDYVLVLDVTQQQLEGAQGFNEENWPNFADTNFTRELDRRYKVDRTATSPQTTPRQ